MEMKQTLKTRVFLSTLGSIAIAGVVTLVTLFFYKRTDLTLWAPIEIHAAFVMLPIIVSCISIVLFNKALWKWE